MESKSLKIAITTVSNLEQAKELSNLLIQEQLAACVNTIKIENSCYSWEDQIQNDAEYLLLMKTTKDQEEELKNHVVENHPYDIPMFYILDANNVSSAYHEWLINNLK